jgi:hypothetical protein
MQVKSNSVTADESGTPDVCAVYNAIRNDLAKSWECQYLDKKGLPLPDAMVIVEKPNRPSPDRKPAVLHFEQVPAGYWFSAEAKFPAANKGQVEGMIYPPQNGHKASWRICYGDCTEHADHLRGKVNDKPTLESAKHFLESQLLHW